MPIWLFLILGILGGVLQISTASFGRSYYVWPRRIVGLLIIAAMLEGFYLLWRDR